MALDPRPTAAASTDRDAVVHGAFRSFVLDPHYSCVGARSAVHSDAYRLGVYTGLGSAAATVMLARDLAAFARSLAAIDAPFTTYVATFEPLADRGELAFECALWAQLQALHDVDAIAWDPAVRADPRDPRFAFSFAGTAFFVVGLHPDSPRVSRRFPWPALIFNPHAQFARLRASGRYERMQKVIRDKECALQGDINPALGEFGTASEARQYSGRLVPPDWTPPFHPRLSDERPTPGVPYRIPAHSGVAFRIRRGQTLRIVDPQGLQVCDLHSVAGADPREHLSSGRSIDYADTLYLTTGHVLYSNRERAMWTIGRDDVGRHDLVLTPCSPEMYRRLRGDDGTHPSCYENLRIPMAAFGVESDSIGSTFNIFMDVRFDPTTGKMTIAPPASAAGDTIELRAELDMIVGLTACSSEVTNAGSLKPIDFEVIEA
jgi:uncharacterized protein YcgI (DUF1989 family)